MSPSFREEGMVFLDEVEANSDSEITVQLHRGKYKMSDSAQHLLILCIGIIILVGVIFTGSYYVGQGNKELKLKQMEKGYVYCRNMDGNSGWNPPARCRNQ